MAQIIWDGNKNWENVWDGKQPWDREIEEKSIPENAVLQTPYCGLHYIFEQIVQSVTFS